MLPRPSSRSGVAIGPILFIVAILAVLATAIAAGSSTFSTNSSQETNRTNAAALIQIGQNLKMGVDRIITLGTAVENVVINSANTVNSADLFSPTGGGLIPPATTLSSDGSQSWIYSWADITGLGTSSLERIALLRVTLGVCNQINTQAGNPGDATNDTNGDFGSNMEVNITANWPSNLDRKMVGCIDNINGSGNAYYFYQVLAVQ